MRKKKAHWRQGIVVSREGEPDKPASIKTPEGTPEADRYLEKAALERDPARQFRYLNQAKIVGMLGRINERMVDVKGYNRGRPKGSTREREDAPALTFMEKTAVETGETRPYRLARLAVEAGLVPVRGTEKSRMDRLAGRWKRHIQKK